MLRKSWPTERSPKKITPLWDSAVQEVLPDEDGKAKGIRVKNLKTGNESEVPCKGVFIAIGHASQYECIRGNHSS